MYILKYSIPVTYADDNTLCAKGKTLGEALERVRQDIEATIDWFDNNKMQANPVKFQYMHTSKTEDIVFECKDIQIQPDKIVKRLGIHHIHNMLKLTEHVSGVTEVYKADHGLTPSYISDLSQEKNC